MGIVSILFLSVGLAMDAFAVALASGSAAVPSRLRHALKLAAAFGAAQMIMPLAGWLLGSRFVSVVQAVDHWIAFGLLAGLGIKMWKESFDNPGCERSPAALTARRLGLLALATSLDAFAVGFSFALLGTPVFVPSLVIGAVTFVIAFIGGMIGCFCCCVWGRRAERLGGSILVLIGINILWQHLCKAPWHG